MRKLKKLWSVMMAVALVGVAVLPAYATSAGTGMAIVAAADSTADITVATGNEGDVLSAYRVVEAVLDVEANTLDYKFSALFEKFQANSQEQTVKDLTPDEYCELVKAVGEDDDIEGTGTSDFRRLLGEFSAYIKGIDVAERPVADYTSTTIANETATFNAVAMGQYIILGSGNTNGAYVYQTVTAEVIPHIIGDVYMLYPEYTVQMKTTTPTATKAITNGTTEDSLNGEEIQTASIGDTVTFELTATVPTYSEGATNTTFFMSDVLSNGLTFAIDEENPLKVMGYGYEAGQEATIPSDAYTASIIGQKLYIDFDKELIPLLAKVTVSYNAILNENAKIGCEEGNPNDYTLVYSNDPFEGTTYEPPKVGEGEDPEEDPNRPNQTTPGYGNDTDQEVVYTYGFAIYKYGVDEEPIPSRATENRTGEDKASEPPLAGAVFEIYTDYDCTEENFIETITTDENGYAAFEGLKKGYYYLKEIKAPTGYKLLSSPVIIELNAIWASCAVTTEKDIVYTLEPSEAIIKVPARDKDGNLVELEGKMPAYVKSITTTFVSENTEDWAIGAGYSIQEVWNVKGSNLPSTGGIGTTIFYIIGAILTLGAAILLITKKRMADRD